MANKMAARVLSYKLGSPSCGDSKLEKWKKVVEKIASSHCQAWFMVNGLFQMWQRMVTFSATNNGEGFS